MYGRNSVIGICVLCALVIGALSVPSASAEQRAVTCIPGGTEFEDSHCLKAGDNGLFGFDHADIMRNGLPTGITFTNGKTASNTSAAAPSKLRGALSGVETEIQCTGLNGTGTLENSFSSVSGSGKINYTGCTVTKPAGKGCQVTGGIITTNTVKATTAGQSAGNLKLEPFVTEFAGVPIQSCSVAALNKTFPVTGSLIASVSGATTTTTHAGVTTQGTLKFGGVKAGLEGAVTVSRQEGITWHIPSSPEWVAGDPITLT